MKKFRIISFGSAGHSISNTLLLNQFEQSNLFYFDTDSTALHLSLLINKFQIGLTTTYGKGTRGDVQLAKKVFKEDIDLFKRILKPDVFYIIIGGFGGGLFTGIISDVIQMLQESKKKFMIVGSMPFSFEGKGKTKLAIHEIKDLNQHTDHLLLLKNDDLQKFLGDMTVEASFRKIDHIIVEIVKEVLFEYRKLMIVSNKSIPLTIGLEDIILQIKKFLYESEYPISTSSSKIIIADTNNELLKAMRNDTEYTKKISPRKFEELVEYIYKLSGYETQLTPQSRDNGADVLVWTPPPVMGNKFLTVVQAKKYSNKNKIGSDEIRELMGTTMFFNADKAQMVTTSDYSGPAIKTAKHHKVDLLKFYELNDAIQEFLD